MQSLSYSCVQHLRRGTLHVRESSRRACPAGRRFGAASSALLRPTHQAYQAGLGQLTEQNTYCMQASDFSAWPLTAAGEWQAKLNSSAAVANQRRDARRKYSSHMGRRRVSERPCGICHSSTYNHKQRRRRNPRVERAPSCELKPWAQLLLFVKVFDSTPL